MEQILLAEGLSKETVTAIIILHENTKVKVYSPDGDANFFNIVTGVLQYLFLISLNYTLWTSIDLMKENGYRLKKARCRQYLAKTIMDADYVDDIVLLANTPA